MFQKICHNQATTRAYTAKVLIDNDDDDDDDGNVQVMFIKAFNVRLYVP